jgi:hypothetical protein
MESPFTKALVKSLAGRLQGKYFSEEYDFHYDSLSDAKERRRGNNPMSQEYTDRMNAKRRELGVSELGPDGLAQDGTSQTLAHQWATDLVAAHESELIRDLSLALFNEDPAGTMCKENDCDDEYDYIAASIMADPTHLDSFKDSLKNALENSFGEDVFVDPRINDESIDIGERKRIANVDLASELAGTLINRVVTHYVELFEKEPERVGITK